MKFQLPTQIFKLFSSFISIFILVNASLVFSQQTLGVFVNDTLTQDGYILFSPSGSPYTYLIDRCGREIHKWQSPYSPGQSVYLLENGNLLRTARIGNVVFSGGGSGGRIEEYDWNGNLVWGYDYSSSEHQQHHDIEPLPNGNILVLAREIKTPAEAIAAGRNPTNAPANGLWPETVVELQKVGTDSAIVVWKWQMWDHLVQEFDSTKQNFAEVSDHPELLNLNFLGQLNGVSDWCHANSVKYNPVLDQIIISSRQLSEFWVIDHSTTTSEAATHSGGNSGKGGDFLYRWGNPRAYQRGTMSDQKMFGQHSPHWIPAGLPNEGKILVFNNGVNRPGGNYSSVEILSPPVDGNGNYSIVDPNAFGPVSSDWIYTSTPQADFYSGFISGAQQLPNGNILICEGDEGHFFEADNAGTLHWDYINPAAGAGPLTQGDSAVNNGAFRVTLYLPDYPAFTGKDLTPGLPIELNPTPVPCNDVAGVHSPYIQSEIKIVNTIVNEELMVLNPLKEVLQIRLYDMCGKEIDSVQNSSSEIRWDLSGIPQGLYIVNARSSSGEENTIRKILRW